MSDGHAKRPRHGYIDAIRGIAALMVVYFHVARDMLFRGHLSPIDHALFGVAANSFDFGKIGVTLFFAVSGFVIPYSLLGGKTYPVRDFVISRFFRLYPAYWVSIPIGVIAFFVLAGVSASPLQIFVNATMLQQFVGVDNIIGAYWTLQIELIFYALCVLMFVTSALQSNRKVFMIALACLALALAMAGMRFVLHKNLPVALALALSIMLLGLLWRRHLIDRDAEARRLAIGLLAALVVLIIPVALLAYGPAQALGYVLCYWESLGLFVLLTRFVRIESRLFSYLGAISYSVYLFGSAARVFAHALVPDGLGGVIEGQVVALVTISITLAIAIPVYHLVEKPAIALGRGIAKRLDRGRALSPTPEVI